LRIYVTEAANSPHGGHTLLAADEAAIVSGVTDIINRAPRIILGLRAGADPGCQNEYRQHNGKILMADLLVFCADLAQHQTADIVSGAGAGPAECSPRVGFHTAMEICGRIATAGLAYVRTRYQAWNVCRLNGAINGTQVRIKAPRCHW
jgi:hypothetical protein